MQRAEDALDAHERRTAPADATVAERALQSMDFAPPTRLHRAVALRYTEGTQGALADVDGLAGELDRYHLFRSVRADLLRDLHLPDEAGAADRLALELTANPAERALHQERAGF